MFRTGDSVEGLDHHAYKTGQSDFAGEDQPHQGPERVYVDPYSDMVLDTCDTDLDPLHDPPSRTSYVGSPTQYFDPQEEYQQTQYRSDSRQRAIESYRTSRRSNSIYTPRRVPIRPKSPLRVNKIRAMHDPYPRAGDQRDTSHLRSGLPVRNVSTSSRNSYSGTASRREAAFQASLSRMNSGSTSHNSNSGAGYQGTPPAITITQAPPLPRRASLSTAKSQSYFSPADPTCSPFGSRQTDQVPTSLSMPYTSSGASTPSAATQETGAMWDDVDYHRNDAFLRHDKARESGVSYVRAQNRESGIEQLAVDFGNMSMSSEKTVRRG